MSVDGGDDGPEVCGQRVVSSRRDERRTGRLAFRIGRIARRRPGAAESIRRWPKRRSPRCIGRFNSRLVRACHDLSEGGLAVAAAEMAFAGGLEARIFLEQSPHHIESMLTAEAPSPAAVSQHNAMLLFAESNSRFLCEVSPDVAEAFEEVMGDVPHAAVGEVLPERRLQIVSVDPGNPVNVVDADIDELKEAWQSPLRW